MSEKPWLINEDARLRELESSGILDTPPEDDFDDIVRRASEICETPVALMSFVADNRQWFKAKTGFDACETPLSQSVCAYVLSEADILIIPDLTIDPRTRDNTLVTEEPNIRFYAGAKIQAADGTALGSLCVIDTERRPQGLTADQTASLKELARESEAKMRARRSA